VNSKNTKKEKNKKKEKKKKREKTKGQIPRLTLTPIIARRIIFNKTLYGIKKVRPQSSRRNSQKFFFVGSGLEARL
jgi:hypothetical protein